MLRVALKRAQPKPSRHDIDLDIDVEIVLFADLTGAGLVHFFDPEIGSYL